MGSRLETDGPQRDGSLVLRFIVVGGGLAGLATAIALARQNHIVSVLEAQNSFSQMGAGVQLQPNCCKILKHLGILEPVRLLSTIPERIDFRSYRNGELLSQTGLLPEMEANYGVPHLIIHRGRLLGVLLEEAAKLGVQLHTDCTVTRLDFYSPAVFTKDGREFNADFVIGADGQRSYCLTALNGADLPDPPPKKMVYRTTVPCRRLKMRDDTMDLGSPAKITYWMGPAAYVVCYTLAHEDVFNIVLTKNMPEKTSPLWGPGFDVTEELKETFHDWDPLLSHLMGLRDTRRWWPLTHAHIAEKWAHEGGKFTLVGDAAHTLAPYLAQGASQAFEDAAFLGELIGRARSSDQVSDALRSFESVRKERLTSIARMSEAVGQIWELADGSMQKERDRQLKEMPASAGYANPYFDPSILETLYGYDLLADVDKTWKGYQKGE